MITDILRVVNILGSFGLLLLFAVRVTQQTNKQYRRHLIGTVMVNLAILVGSSVHLSDMSEKGLSAQIFVSLALGFWYTATWSATVNDIKASLQKRRAAKRR